MILGDVCTGRAAFAAWPRGGRGRPTPTSRSGWARRPPGWGSNTWSSPASPATICLTAAPSISSNTIRAVRAACGATVEVLPSDFAGNRAAVDQLVDAAPEVYNHNTETVPRLFASVRGRKADYRWTLEMFRRIRRRNPAIRTKTGLMLGPGRNARGVAGHAGRPLRGRLPMLTLGQYLQPSPAQMPVVRYLEPAEFAELGARPAGWASSRSPPGRWSVRAITPG